MFKFYIALITSLFALSFTSSVNAIETEQWECAVNLHQGDSGTLSFERTGDDINGMLSIKRNTSVFENEIIGYWSGNEIDMKRLLNSSSNDLMAGIVIPVGTEKVKMGGRFSADYQGVWSADCDLVSFSEATSNNSSNNTSNNSSNIIQPSTTSRVSPSNPTNRDRIKFFTSATHPDGIESVSFFIDGKQVHTCQTNTCEFSNTRLTKGDHTWYVLATSKSGIKNKVSENKLAIQTKKTKNNCSISGQATGPSSELSSLYLVNLFGQNNSLRASTRFENNRYKFSGLAAGEYTVKIDTRSDKAVIASPLTKTIKCKSGADITINFNLN